MWYVLSNCMHGEDAWRHRHACMHAHTTSGTYVPGATATAHRLASHAGRAMASYNYLLAAVPTERSYRAKEKRPASAASDPMELQVASRPQRREYQWDVRVVGPAGTAPALAASVTVSARRAMHA
jgi:hypothetical protein